MATRNRRVRRRRGSRTCGWGVSGQHRKGGMRGGHGKSGWGKHKWTYTLKYDFKRIGKHGFVNPTSRKKAKTINVGELEGVLRRGGEVEEKGVIDLTEMGYDKLLGEGALSRPCHIRIKEWSETARKKIEHAGGVIQTEILEDQ